MATKGGNNSVQDGLLFYYDTGNTRKSFKGEPTTNVLLNTDLDYGWSKSYCLGIQWNDIAPPKGVDSPVVSFHDANDASGYWYSYGDFAPQVPGETYTISIYVKTRDSNFRIYAYTADNAEVGRVQTNTVVVPNDDKWHRIVFNPITNPANSESDSLSFKFDYGNTIPGESQRTWLCAPQMEAKPYPTPFTPNARTTTESLYDLTGNVALDVSNVSFDSDGMFYDRASYNRINTYFGNGIDPTVTTFTVEAIVKAKILQSNPMWVSTTGWGNNQRFYSAITTSDTRRTGYQGVLWQSANTPDLLWHHQVITMDGTNIKCFDNGELVYTGSYTSYTLPSDIYFGSGNNTHSWDGQIPVAKIYNKALTTDEVKRNFNSYKGRFNL
jgi:hypothetical protein